MSRIEIRGIIVPSDFDGGWYASLAERGIITPESKFRRELAAAPAGEPLTVYVNSPGGSVFAGNEMVNAVTAWKAQTKQSVHVVLGAMAASMGAAFTVQAADKVSVHRNSLMMFHGAWGVQIGGADAMHDYGEVLSKINAETKRVLLARYNLDAKQVDEWFAEGREGWLTADEMKAAGIASEIIGVDDAALDLSDADLGEYETKGLKIAALAQGLKAMKSEVKNDVGNNAAQSGEPGTAGSADNQENDDGEASEGTGGGNEGTGGGEAATQDQGGGALRTGDGGQSGSAEADASVLIAEREAGRIEGRDAAIAEWQGRFDDVSKQLADAKQYAAKLQSERDQARNELAKARTEHAASLNELSAKMKAASDRLARHLDGSLAFSPAPQTWEEALKQSGGDYVAARRAYPDLLREYNTKNKSR